MTRTLPVTLHIPEPLLNAVAQAARQEDITAGEFIRMAVAERAAEVGGQGAGSAVATIRRELRRDFAEAVDWIDLQRRLRSRNLVLRESGGEIWLKTWPLEQRLLPLVRLGPSRDDLTLRFRAPFPTHGAAFWPRHLPAHAVPATPAATAAATPAATPAAPAPRHAA